jgi:hypothetical protein
MKKLLFITILLAFIISTASSQIIQKTAPAVKQNVIIKTIPPPPPPPAPPPSTTNKSTTTGNQNAPVYSLTSARVSIRTGNDNKEFPSKVFVTLMAKSTPANWRNYIQINLDNEMRINSDTEFGLDLEGRPPTPLETFQTAGLKLSISYEPNFFADAWKIENVSLTLEFKDQNSNLHPTLGHKTIVFSNAYGFLNNEFRYMECVTDASFAPLTAVIKKTY